MSIKEQIMELQESIPQEITLVAVSKTHPPETVLEAYEAGLRIFGENRAQELTAKYEVLPSDIRWHMIGHLQTNKVKYIAPFVDMIQSADSHKLIKVIDKEAREHNRVIDILLEVHIAREDSKNGWKEAELLEFLSGGAFRNYNNVCYRGLMGIASLTDDKEQVKKEFGRLRTLHEQIRGEYFPDSEMAENAKFDILSMGMTSDWELAVECGSNMVRIGSAIFGNRDYGF